MSHNPYRSPVAESDRLPVVYVAGSGHSGSTLLALLLDSHPEIACVGETSIKPRIRRRGASAGVICSCGAPISECAWWNDVFVRVRREGYRFGPEHWTNDYRFEQPLARRLMSRASVSPTGRSLLLWSGRYLPFYRQRIAAIDRVNVAFIRAVLDASRARVFADTTKLVGRLLYMQRTSALDVKTVHLVRDVRAYAASAKRRGIPPLDAARTWKLDQQAVLDVTGRQPPGVSLRLRYEDLCGEVSSTLAGLWAFCGVAGVAAPEVVDASEHHVLGNSMRSGGAIRVRLDETWRARLTEQEQSEVLAVAGDLNQALGYSSDETRRLELGGR